MRGTSLGPEVMAETKSAALVSSKPAILAHQRLRKLDAARQAGKTD